MKRSIRLASLAAFDEAEGAPPSGVARSRSPPLASAVRAGRASAEAPQRDWRSQRRGVLRGLVAEQLRRHAAVAAPPRPEPVMTQPISDPADPAPEAAGERPHCTAIVLWRPPQRQPQHVAVCRFEALVRYMTPSVLPPMIVFSDSFIRKGNVDHIAESMNPMCRFAFTNTHMAGVELRRMMTGVGVKEARAGLLSASLAAIHSDVALQSALLQAVSQTCEPLLWVEYDRYDETPMVVKCKSIVPSMRPSEECGSMFPWWDSGALAEQAAAVAVASEDKGCCKLLQYESSWCATFRSPSGSVFSISAETVQCLTALEKNDSACMFQRTVSLPRVRPPVPFRRQVRAATSDDAAANSAFERRLVSSYGGGFSSLHFKCRVHKVAAVSSRTFRYMDDHVSGLVHMALSLKDGGRGAAFRRVMSCVLMVCINIVVGAQPSVEALAFRKAALDLFLSGGPRHQMKAYMLRRCFSGDWRCRGDITVVLQHDISDKLALTCNLANMVPHILAGRSLPVFQRARWTKWDQPIDQVGLGEAFHGVWSTTFILWTKFNRTGLLPTADEVRSIACPDGFARWAAATQAGAAAEAQSAPPETQTRQHHCPPQQQQQQHEQPSQTWAERNDHHRRSALQWLAMHPCGPLGMLALMRNIGEPARQLMQSALAASGLEADVREATRIAHAASSGPAGAAGPRPSSRVVESAQGLELDAHVDALRALGFAGAWGALPQCFWTLGLQTVAFKAASVAGAAYWELIHWPRRGYPWRMFLLLSDATFGATVLQEFRDTPCLFDGWSSDFVRAHGESISDPQSVAVLELALLAQVVKEDIAQIEAQHASVRRFILARSLQSPGVRLDETSCNFVLGKLRSRWADLQKMHGRSAQRVGAARSQQPPPAAATDSKKKRGAGGPWRAFIHVVSWGHFADFRELARQYHALTPEERQWYTDLGDRGRQRARDGQQAFGECPKKLRRRLRSARAAQDSDFSMCAAADADGRPGVEAETSLALIGQGDSAYGCADVGAMVRGQRRAARALAAQDAKQ